MKNIKLTIAYDGAPFHGWQIQPNAVTVQETLKKAIETITSDEKVNLIGAGRTDAGVHALGQVANFMTEKKLDGYKWKGALNSLLPGEISVLKAEFVPDTFHSRYSATEKSYAYHIGFKRSPFLYKREWMISHPLNIQSMKKALTYLIGKHDFSSFASTLSESQSKVCHLIRGEISKKKESVTITLTADRFLTHMVRIIVGTLVKVGSGKIKASEIRNILEMKNRTKAGQTAPPHGLYLVEVRYPKDLS